jgi:hypothetical protein
MRMPSKWVDNKSYFGADRRLRPSKRWNDRRRHDESGEPPPLGALLRRLRVRVAGPSADDRQHALEMVKAAIAEASRLNWRHCAAALVRVDQILRTNGGRQATAAAEALIVEALEHAGAGR